MDRCIDEIVAASAGRVTREDAAALLDLADQRAQRLQGELGLSGEQAAQQAGKELSEAAAAAAAIARRNALLNLRTRIARRENIRDIAAAAGKDGEPNLRHAVLNQIVARNAPARGSRLSAEAIWKSREGEYQGRVVTALDKVGLLKAFRRGTLEQDWGRELYELSRASAGEAGARPGYTGNAAALEVAKIVHGVQELARTRLNRVGAWIGSYAGYITRTMHDAAKLRDAGFAAWRDFILPRLSPRTFEGVEDRNSFLRGTYQALANGVHLADHEQVGMKDAAFSGPANLAARISEGKKLHFADADGWLQYQQQFGRGSLAEQVLSAFGRAARQEALLRRFGTNPVAELDNDLKYLVEKNRDTHPDAVRALRDGEAAIRLRMDYLTGEANRPSNPSMANIMAGIRAIGSMAHLGNVAFTHLSSFATKAAELRYGGIGWLEAYGNSVTSLLQGRGAGATRELSDLLLAGIEGMHGHMLSRFSGDDALTGTTAKLANFYFRATTLTYMLDAQKSGAARIVSRQFGAALDRGFDALDPEMQRTLTAYGLTPAEWNAVRSVPDPFRVDGRAHLTPDMAGRIDDERLAQAAGKLTATAPQLARARDDIELKLRTMFDDIAHRSVITPGIDERALLFGGTRPGTLAGEALRFIAQFKLWGVAAARQGLGREIYGGQGTAGAVSGIVQLALGTAVMGYLTMTLKDLVQLKVPRSPTDPRTVMAAMIQGGGYGIIGDYAFGQFNRFGQTPIEALAGPTAGTLGDLANLVSLARGSLTADPNARPQDAGPALLHLAQNNTPFLNLFYTRWVLDYLLFHSLQESMNPGYLRRSERSLQQRTGQTYILSPQNHAHTFGR